MSNSRRNHSEEDYEIVDTYEAEVQVKPIINDEHYISQISEDPFVADKSERDSHQEITQPNINTPEAILGTVASYIGQLTDNDEVLTEEQKDLYRNYIKETLREFGVSDNEGEARTVSNLVSKFLHKLHQLITIEGNNEEVPYYLEHAIRTLQFDFKLCDTILKEKEQDKKYPPLTVRSLMGVACEIVEAHQTEIYYLWKEDKFSKEALLLMERVIPKAISDLSGYSNYSLTGDLALCSTVNDLIKCVQKFIIDELELERSKNIADEGDINYFIHKVNEFTDDLIFDGVRRTLFTTRRLIRTDYSTGY